MQINELIDILACPACRGSLTYQENSKHGRGFLCAHCQLLYPVEDEIPVMLIERAIPVADGQEEIK